MILSVPVERSGQNWFEPEWGRRWLAFVTAPPGLREGANPGQPGVPLRAAEQQQHMLRCVSTALRGRACR